MTTVKLSELTELTTPSSNTEKTFLLVTDTQTGLAVSKKMSVKTLDTLIDVTQGQANLAFNHANSSFNHANSGFNHANAAFIRANNSLSANSGGIVTGDVSITGNLTVTGVTTYTNTQTVLVADNILTLNAAINQSAAPSLNAGLEIDRGSSANVYLLWNESNDKWTFTEDGTNYDNIGSASTASYANAAFLQANTPSYVANSAAIYANGAFVQANVANNNANAASNYANAAFNQANAAFTVGFSTAIYANGAFDKANAGSNIATNLAVTGNTTITSNVSVGGNITPTTTLTSNLGNSDFRFHSLFLGPDSVYLGSNLSIGAVTYPGYIGGSVDAVRIKNSSYLITALSFDDSGMIHHSNVSGSPVISITDTLGYLSRLEGSFGYSSTNTTSYWANTAPIDVQSAIDRITVAVYQLRDNIANGTAITTSLIE